MRHLLILACLLFGTGATADEADFDFKSLGAKKALRDYKATHAKEDKAKRKAIEEIEAEAKKAQKTNRVELIMNLEQALKKALQDADLEEANKIDAAIKALRKGASPAGASVAGSKGKKKAKKSKDRIPRDAVAIAFPLGQWVDVLSRVDVNKHALEGHWTKRGQDIVVNQRKTACRLIVPVAPTGDYDFEIQFSRLSEIPDNWHTSVAIVPIGSSSCCILFNTDGPSGVDRIYGRRPDNNGNPTSLRITMKNNRRYIAVISVRYQRNQEATIRVSLDGQVLFVWSGPVNAFSLNSDWEHLWPSNTLGLGAFCTQTVFHTARLRMVSGKALDVKNAKQAKMPIP